MSSNELLNIVLKSNFIEPKEVMLELMSGNNKSDKARKKIGTCVSEHQYIGMSFFVTVLIQFVWDIHFIEKDENVASTKHNATVMQDTNNPSALLDVDYETFDFKKHGH